MSTQAGCRQRCRWGWPASAAGALGLSAVIWLLPSCSRQQDNSNPSPSARQRPPVPVLVASVARRDVPMQLRSIGTVEAYAVVGVKTQVSGLLTEVHVKEGQAVGKGDLLFVIDPRPAQVALDQAQANLARDEAQFKNAQRNAKRVLELFKRNAATQDELDQANTQAEALAATVLADKATIENAKLQLAYSYIRSPVDGVAGSLMVNQGNVVKANDQALITLNQVKPIYVTFSVPQQYLPDIRRYTGAGPLHVQAALAGGQSDPPEGLLTFVDNTMDVSAGTIRLKGRFGNQDERLWPGQFVEAVLTLTVQADSLVVPSQAVQTGQQGEFVYVVNDDLTVRMQPVITGTVLEGQTVINQGLLPGQTVVTDGQLRLFPGAKIEVKSELSSRGGVNAASGKVPSATAPASRRGRTGESRP